MITYVKRIILAFIGCGILLILLETYAYHQYGLESYEFFVYNIGVISEECPDKLDNVVSRVSQTSFDQDIYQKGEDALAKLGYGEVGRSYFMNTTKNTTLYYITIVFIVLCLFFLGYYVIHFIVRLRSIGKHLVYSMEHAITKYPITIKTIKTNIPPVNKIYTQINILFSQLNHQIELLKNAQNDRTIFIENISHQIKTPLTCISLDLELLTNLKDQNKAILYIDSCYTQIDHIESLVNRLLKIGKLESGKVQYEFLEHNLLDTILVLCNHLEEQYPTKKIKLTYNKEDSYTISYDIVWLYEALENIAKNCYLYSYDACGIEIELVRYESYIKIVLCDHGIGIATNDLPYIFDRFYRSEQSKGREGFGIGLNLAKLVVECHHGTIFAKSDNHSTQFIIHLPLIY